MPPPSYFVPSSQSTTTGLLIASSINSRVASIIHRFHHLPGKEKIHHPLR
jgi:hypothetical protein